MAQTNASTATLEEAFMDYIPGKEDNLYRDWYPFMALWVNLYIFGGFPGNLLIIVAFIRYPNIRNPTSYLIFNQSAVDLATCFTGQAFTILNYTKQGIEIVIRNKYACFFSLATLVFSLMSSLANLLALSTERMVAVVFPYKYFCWVTERLVLCVIVVELIVLLSINIIPALGWNNWEPGKPCFTMNVYPSHYTMFCFLLPLLIMLVLLIIFNIIICTIALSKEKKIQPAVEPSNNSLDYRITKSILLIMCVFFLSWGPFIVLSIVFMARYPWMPPNWFLVMHDISKGFIGLNGVCNPFIFARGCTKFKVAIYNMLGMKNRLSLE